MFATLPVLFSAYVLHAVGVLEVILTDTQIWTALIAFLQHG